MQKSWPVEKSAFPSLELHVLGSFEVNINGSPLPHLRTRKGGILLALLALKGERPLERSWLAGTLWPDSAPEQALYNLRQSLTDLRRALGPAAELLHSPTPRTLLLHQESVSCDALRFDRLAAQDNVASWKAALALYTGPLLDGWYEECLLQERQSREEAFQQVLHRLAEQAQADQNWAEAIGFLERLLTVEPQREGTWQHLMQARAACGDYAGMTEVYRRFRLYLHEALSTSPAAETTALYQQLRNRPIVLPHRNATLP